MKVDSKNLLSTSHLVDPVNDYQQMPMRLHSANNTAGGSRKQNKNYGRLISLAEGQRTLVSPDIMSNNSIVASSRNNS